MTVATDDLPCDRCGYPVADQVSSSCPARDSTVCPRFAATDEPGCPHEGTCCDAPRTHPEGCDCDEDDPECVCEGRWTWICDNCGDSCNCEV